jgi:hypothetical protein
MDLLPGLRVQGAEGAGPFQLLGRWTDHQKALGDIPVTLPETTWLRHMGCRVDQRLLVNNS